MSHPNGAPPGTLQIHSVPASDVEFSEENHNRELAIDDLLASMATRGQLLPAVSAKLPGSKPVTIDGNRRLAACRKLGILFQTIILDKMVTKAEAIEIRLTANTVRKQMTLKQIGQDVAAFIDLTGCTQKEAAAKLGFPEGVVQRALSLSLLAEEELKRLHDAGLCWSGITLIAPLTGERRAKAMAFVCDRTGEPCRKEELLLFLKGLKSPKQGRKPKALRGKFNKREFSVALLDQDGPSAIADWLSQLAAKVKKAGEDLSVDGLPFLFR